MTGLKLIRMLELLEVQSTPVQTHNRGFASGSQWGHTSRFVTFPVSNFTKSNLHVFVANNDWPPNLSDLNPLDYQAWGNCNSLITNCNRSGNSSQVCRCTLADLVCDAGDSH